jgi:hypothetical protein
VGGEQVAGEVSAVISECGRYRYRLERELGPISIPEITAAVIMVNPSTADAEQDDATIRKLKGFGERNGWSRFIVGNLFAYRATDVAELARVQDPVGIETDIHLCEMLSEANFLLVAWGKIDKVPRDLRDRWRDIVEFAAWAKLEPMCLGVNSDGHPAHPVMLGYDQPMIPWTAPR